MLRYIIRRIFIFIPTLVVITLLGFILNVNAPGDPVERMVVAAQSGGEVGSQTVNQIEQKKYWRKKLGLDLPVFYITLSTYSKPDTLYRIFDKNEREALERLILKYGNWPEISRFYTAANVLYLSAFNVTFDSLTRKQYSINEITDAINQLKFESLTIKSSFEDAIIRSKLMRIKELYDKYSFLSGLRKQLNNLTVAYDDVKKNPAAWKNYIPKINFYGNNQYHRWIFGDGNWLTGEGAKFSRGLLRGDFGTSYVTKQPISEVISSKIGWSLFFSLASVVLAYFVSIPLGVKAAAERGSRFDRSSSVVLFILYSMPSFWVATLLLMTFANPDVLPWFPASGVKPAEGYSEAASLWQKIRISTPYLVLPLICYTYGSFAFLSRTMRVSMLEIIGQDYIRTANAKGLSKTRVIWKHAFRNSLLPIITVFANIFPMAIGGSVILETIFTIPGLGFEAIFAIQNQNYPMIMAILTITGILTLVGYLVSDILYAAVDPRISYSKKG